ncbi:MAG: c-type cytochrome [Candidatus Marinarcus sp.]|uniref:c-type cytochrome n=1 Tax=Candidatus Marinarcus sp. TaxID=3100987 RepID=UPI003B00BFBF
MKKLLLIITLTSLYAFAQTPEVPKTYPNGELGKMVKLGEAIMNETNTHPLTKDFVGNNLQCKSCHIQGADGKPGTITTIGTFRGTAASFPAFSGREKTVQTLQDRINNCYMRSMNGTRPIVDTKASVAMAAYITWLSTGFEIKMDEKRPCSVLTSDRWAAEQKKFAAIQKKATHENYLAGKKTFETKCASCHGANGKGMAAFPPLWGQDEKGKWLSYNTGAGMSKLNKAPAWIKENMPLGQGGTLSDQEAADVALFINAQPRASFDLKDHLLPKEKMGHYNSDVHEEKHSVESNFKAFGLDLKTIKGN